jgi:hypothetical protein
MCGTSYRPRPDNGSGDSPRPPFLTEFVNHVGKLALTEVVYHLIGGQLGLRIHPHVEWSFRLKTEASRGIPQLQTAHAQVCQNPVNPIVRRYSFVIRQISEGSVPQLDVRPVKLIVTANH